MKIVCLCGIDGSGKSSILNLLTESAIADKLTFKSFNYRDNVHEFILQTPQIKTSSINNYSASIKKKWIEAYAMDFRNFFKNEIEPFQETSTTIICDRWYHCILAFQVALDVPSSLNKNLFPAIPQGDLIFHIQMDPKTAYERQFNSNISGKKNLLLLEKYQNGYTMYFKKQHFKIFKIYNENLQASTSFIFDKISQFT